MINVLRWVLIFPGAFFATSGVAYVLGPDFFLSNLLRIGGEWGTILNNFFVSITCGFVFVVTAGWIAPSYKMIIVLVAIGIYVVLIFATYFVVITQQDYLSVYPLIGSLIGAIIAGIYFINSVIQKRW